MNPKLKESISNTLQEGLNFIERITHLIPAEIIQEKDSISKSFLKLLRILNEKSNNTSNDHKVVNNNNVDERKPMAFPPDTTEDEYLIIQENNNNNIPTNSHTPRIRLNITVNRKLKGMYYCLMEKEFLLLDRNINAEHSEYVIPLSEYTFQAVNNFTIKLTRNELEIALLFSSMIDRNTWLNYITAARDSVYSYVTIDRCNVNTIPTPKVEMISSLFLPIRKSRSVDIVLQPDSDFVDLTNISIDTAKKGYESRLPRNNVKAPLPISPNEHSSDQMENVTPNQGFNRFRRFLAFKHSKPALNNTRRVNIIPQPTRVVALSY